MRRKSEEKRQCIIATAKKIFIRKGFNATPMSEISASVGGSKATLYNYFSSKEVLFGAVMQQIADDIAGPLFTILKDEEAPLKNVLIKFGVAYLTFVLSPQTIAMRRMALAELHTLAHGEEIFRRGPIAQWEKMAGFFEKNMQSGRMKKADAWRTTMQFLTLIEQEYSYFSLLGIQKKLSAEAIKASVETSVDIFWHYYALPPAR